MAGEQHCAAAGWLGPALAQGTPSQTTPFLTAELLNGGPLL